LVFLARGRSFLTPPCPLEDPDRNQHDTPAALGGRLSNTLLSPHQSLFMVSPSKYNLVIEVGGLPRHRRHITLFSYDPFGHSSPVDDRPRIHKPVTHHRSPPTLSLFFHRWCSALSSGHHVICFHLLFSVLRQCFHLLRVECPGFVSPNPFSHTATSTMVYLLVPSIAHDPTFFLSLTWSKIC